MAAIRWFTPFKRPVILLGIVIGGVSSALLAQQPSGAVGLTQENVVREALTEFPGTDALTFNGVFAPGGTSGKHRHPGTEVLHVIAGHGVLIQEGHEPVELAPGTTIVAEPEAKGGSFVHELRNTSATEVLRTYVVLLVDKGEPPFFPVQ